MRRNKGFDRDFAEYELKSAMQQLPNAREVIFLRLPQVKAATGLSKTSIYEKIKENTFPSPVPIGKRTVGWVEFEIKQWAIDQVMAARSERQEIPHKPARSATHFDHHARLRRSA